MKRSPIFVLFVTIFLDLLGFGIIIPILPIFIKELGAKDFQVGLIAAVYPVMNFMFSPFWGTLSDRFGRRPIILWSVVITAFAYVVFANAQALAVVFISRMLSGIGSANISVAQAYIADVTSPSERAKSMGLIGAAFGLGFIFGPSIGGYLKSISSYGSVDLVGYVTAGLCGLNFILAYFMLPESLKNKKSEVKYNFKVITGIIRELRKPAIRELLWVNFIFTVAFMLMQISCSLMWKEVSLLSDEYIGYVFTFIGIVTAIVQGGLVGRLVKQFGETKLLVYGSFLMMTGMVTLPLVAAEYFIPIELIALALIALANGCLTPNISSLLSKITEPHEVGQTLGVNQSFGSLARATGMSLSGVLYSLNFHTPFLVGAGLMGICVLLTTSIKKKSHN
ncbi:MAG TPA: MFS transporter [Cyclobacteriaceae bacterium]|nr:MFS transporter [Cyclobacteriaceae bacterium]